MIRLVNIVILSLFAAATAVVSWYFYCQFRSFLETFGWSLDVWWRSAIATLTMCGVGFCIAGALCAAAMRSRQADGRCGKCGYSLTGLQSSRCPECGNDPATRPPALTGEYRIMWSVAAVAAGWLIGCAAGEAWLRLDEILIVRECSRTPAVSQRAGRWWPADNAMMLYEPGIGFRAVD